MEKVLCLRKPFFSCFYPSDQSRNLVDEYFSLQCEFQYTYYTSFYQNEKNVMQTKALFLCNLLMCLAQMHPLFLGLINVVHKNIFENDKNILFVI